MTRNIPSRPASHARAARPAASAVTPGARHCERGSSVLELAFMLPFLLFLLIAAADFGRAYYLMIEVADAAHTGALYGTQNPTDVTGMQNAAKGNAANIPSGLSATATYGCECSDGTSAVASCTSTPSCSVNAVNYVQVVTSYTYSPLLPYPGVPSSLTLQGKSRMRASQ